MYGWLWRHLPGGFLLKSLSSLVLLAGALALLFFVVFPYAEPRLPFSHVTVDTQTPTPSPVPSSPSATPPRPTSSPSR
jgi:hypothetical protein